MNRNPFSLIISIVPHNSGEFIVDSAKAAGAAGGSIIMGRGTASNSVIQLLGFGDTSKDIVYILVENSIEKKVIDSIVSASSEKKSHFGVLFTISVNDFIKSGKVKVQNENIQETGIPAQGEENMQNSYQMISIIVNKGYAEDAMAAARKAGASGGTIIAARGTAKEGDAEFFGMQIVPEKDMLIILVPNEKKEDILSSITTLPCFAEPGSGIVFCNEANNFTLLGR